jgi:hypothetical protein
VVGGKSFGSKSLGIGYSLSMMTNDERMTVISRFRRQLAADQGMSTILPLSPPFSEIRWAS